MRGEWLPSAQSLLLHLSAAMPSATGSWIPTGTEQQSASHRLHYRRQHVQARFASRSTLDYVMGERRHGSSPDNPNRACLWSPPTHAMPTSSEGTALAAVTASERVALIGARL